MEFLILGYRVSLKFHLIVEFFPLKGTFFRHPVLASRSILLLEQKFPFQFCAIELATYQQKDSSN